VPFELVPFAKNRHLQVTPVEGNVSENKLCTPNWPPFKFNTTLLSLEVQVAQTAFDAGADTGVVLLPPPPPLLQPRPVAINATATTIFIFISYSYLSIG
jgi:hypothetical protein